MRNQDDIDPEASFPMANFPSTGRFCAYYLERKVANSRTQLSPLQTIITTCLAGYTHLCNGTTNAMEIANSFLIGFNHYSTRQNSCLVLFTGPRTHGWLHGRLQRSIYYYYSTKLICTNSLAMYLYTCSLVHLSPLIFEASFGNI